jgi:superfamily II DNA helicase RecQ
MKNQVDALRGYGVKVHMLSSESTMEERQAASRYALAHQTIG